MGFLDRKSRVIDVVLTERGRRLYADGDLEFSYVAFFDDGIDYDPWSTGTLDDGSRDSLVYSSPMFEAPVVPDGTSRAFPLEPRNHLFQSRQVPQEVPRMLAPTTGSQVDLRCNQSPEEGVYVRYGTGIAEVSLESSDGSSAGFAVHVYSSGSNGLIELDPRRDLRGRRALDPYIAISIDEEVPPETGPSTSRRK